MKYMHEKNARPKGLAAKVRHIFTVPRKQMWHTLMTIKNLADVALLLQPGKTCKVFSIVISLLTS